MGCKDRGVIDPDVTVDAGNDPNFTIIANTDGVLKGFDRKVVVFGIDIYAVPEVANDRLLHAANVMAQYLDNDEDGVLDNQAVVDRMIEEQAFMLIWKTERDLRVNFPNGRVGQDLGNDETQPDFVRNGKSGQFDAALEEVFHIITHAGYSRVYPDVFGEQKGSQLANAMDNARGGQFDAIPNNYPPDAWYTYDDQTCTYDCQVTEYFYWAMSSILGAQENRLAEIGQEWKLNTSDKVETQDNVVYKMLLNDEYKLPNVLPDGSYRH
ncbi:MAG: hypothetical protein AAGK47_10785 [Bacteroidota bacterium]